MKDLKMIVLFSIPTSILSRIFEQYIFGDWEFVKWLVVLMTIDTLLGFIKHWLQHDISSKAWSMIAKKIIIYSSVLILSHVMSNFRIAGELVNNFLWFRYFACSALIVREALSIIENVEEICPGFFPKSIITKLKGFNNTTGNKEDKQ